MYFLEVHFKYTSSIFYKKIWPLCKVYLSQWTTLWRESYCLKAAECETSGLVNLHPTRPLHHNSFSSRFHHSRFSRLMYFFQTQKYTWSRFLVLIYFFANSEVNWSIIHFNKIQEVWMKYDWSINKVPFNFFSLFILYLYFF